MCLKGRCVSATAAAREKEDADTTRDALIEREGGLGILMVKKSMDSVSYSYEDGKNILTISKKIEE